MYTYILWGISARDVWQLTSKFSSNQITLGGKNVHRNLTFKHEIVTTLQNNNVRLTATEVTEVDT
jgi:hypothetical protein